MSVKLKLSQADLRRCTSAADLAQVVMDHFSFAKDHGGHLHRYSHGVYQRDGDEFVGKKVQELFELGGNTDKWSSHRSKEVAAYIRTKAQRLWDTPPAGVINVMNGIVDVPTNTLRSHEPIFLSSIQLPVVYDPDATCPAIDRFYAEVLPADTVHVAYEIAASLIVPFTGIQKAMLLYGEGGNGKSTFLDILVALLGANNVSSISLQQLEERFFAAALVGKLANVCPDLPNEKLRTTATFKAITGGDLISVERKHEAPFNARLFAKPIFSANQLPEAVDRSEAYYRRWVIMPFPNSFVANPKTRRDLITELTSPRELSGLFNRALQALPNVLRRGISESPSMTELMQQFRGGSRLAAWLTEQTVASPEAFVVKKTLWEAFNEDNGCGMTQQAFGRELRRIRPDVGEAQRRLNGGVVSVYTGLEFRSPRVSVV